VFIVVSVYFVIDSVRKLLDTLSYICYGLDDRMIGVRFPAGDGNFYLLHHVQTGSGAQPASYPMGTGGSTLEVKRPGREADHSPPSRAGVVLS